MQDKEFDTLFRSKLNDFEIMPSAKIWGAINGNLNAGKRKGVLYPWLSVAASVLVLVCAGLIFIPKGIKTDNKLHSKHTQVTNKPRVEIIAQAKMNTIPAVVKLNPGIKQQLITAIVNKPVWHQSVKKTQPLAEHAPPTKADESNKIAIVNKPEQIIAVVPDKATPLAVKQADEPSIFISKPAIAVAPAPPDIKTETAPVRTHRRIHTLGDLINLAVAKVDKRRDKFIEFTNTDDDDESNITAVNLGILKIKKEK